MCVCVCVCVRVCTRARVFECSEIGVLQDREGSGCLWGEGCMYGCVETGLGYGVRDVGLEGDKRR